MNTGKRRDQSVNPGCMECWGFTHHKEHCSFWEPEEPETSFGWCECGVAVGKTLIEGVWHWTHGGMVGVPVDNTDAKMLMYTC